MDDHYENANPTDFDVIRSTQFVDNYLRPVRFSHIISFSSCPCLDAQQYDLYLLLLH